MTHKSGILISGHYIILEFSHYLRARIPAVSSNTLYLEARFHKKKKRIYIFVSNNLFFTAVTKQKLFLLSFSSLLSLLTWTGAHSGTYKAHETACD